MALLFDLIFLVLTRFLLVILKMNTWWLRRQKHKKSKSILALPYYPEQIPGPKERMANWKPYFENEGIHFDVHWASNQKEFEKVRSKAHKLGRYGIYFKVLFKRFMLIRRFNQYNTIWIQRSFIPYYPYKKAYFETFLGSIHPNIIMDFYDADYVHNERLINESAVSANKITTSTTHLKHHFEKLNPSSFLVNMTIPEALKSQSSEANNKAIAIGWMGSAGNFKQVEKLTNVLDKIKQTFPDVSIQLVCPKDKRLGIQGISYYNWDDEDFNYNKWLGNITIGMVPFFGKNETLAAKSPMKTLEFMSVGAAIVGNKNSVYEGMNEGDHFMRAESESEWFTTLKKLIEDESLAETLGDNSLRFFKDNHTYKNNFEGLKGILQNT